MRELYAHRCLFPQFTLTWASAPKKWSQDQLTTRLEQGAEIMKAVYSELPSYDNVVPALLEAGIRDLKTKCKLTPGVPLKPMLAKPTKAIGEVLDRFENKRFTCEYKYDGERAQVWCFLRIVNQCSPNGVDS
jgi:DNA ligase 1